MLLLRSNLGFCAALFPAVLWGAMLVGDVRAGPILVDYQPVIVAGSPSGSSPDSPGNRVDPNTTSSPFAGVGSLELFLPGTGTFICTGTPITNQHVLTAAHCLDLLGDDGTIDVLPGNVTFHLNYGGNLTHALTASALAVHPDFTGFNNPSINDDIAVITLASPLPAGVPIYDLYRTPLDAGDTLQLAGYGRSGDGVNGYTVGPSFSVKRSGENVADGFLLDDEGTGSDEIVFWDFDVSNGTNGFTGGPSLGNIIETNLGGGDSGGPAFIDIGGGVLQIAGVNTFTANFIGGPSAPFFGSAGGSMIVPTYAAWVDGVAGTAAPEPSTFALMALSLAGLLAARRRLRTTRPPLNSAS